MDMDLHHTSTNSICGLDEAGERVSRHKSLQSRDWSEMLHCQLISDGSTAIENTESMPLGLGGLESEPRKSTSETTPILFSKTEPTSSCTYLTTTRYATFDQHSASTSTSVPESKIAYKGCTLEDWQAENSEQDSAYETDDGTSKTVHEDVPRMQSYMHRRDGDHATSRHDAPADNPSSSDPTNNLRFTGLTSPWISANSGMGNDDDPHEMQGSSPGRNRESQMHRLKFRCPVEACAGNDTTTCSLISNLHLYHDVNICPTCLSIIPNRNERHDTCARVCIKPSCRNSARDPSGSYVSIRHTERTNCTTVVNRSNSAERSRYRYICALLGVPPKPMILLDDTGGNHPHDTTKATPPDTQPSLAIADIDPNEPIDLEARNLHMADSQFLSDAPFRLGHTLDRALGLQGGLPGRPELPFLPYTDRLSAILSLNTTSTLHTQIQDELESLRMFMNSLTNEDESISESSGTDSKVASSRHPAVELAYRPRDTSRSDCDENESAGDVSGSPGTTQGGFGSTSQAESSTPSHRQGCHKRSRNDDDTAEQLRTAVKERKKQQRPRGEMVCCFKDDPQVLCLGTDKSVADIINSLRKYHKIHICDRCWVRKVENESGAFEHPNDENQCIEHCLSPRCYNKPREAANPGVHRHPFTQETCKTKSSRARQEDKEAIYCFIFHLVVPDREPPSSMFEEHHAPHGPPRARTERQKRVEAEIARVDRSFDMVEELRKESDRNERLAQLQFELNEQRLKNESLEMKLERIELILGDALETGDWSGNLKGYASLKRRAKVDAPGALQYLSEMADGASGFAHVQPSGSTPFSDTLPVPNVRQLPQRKVPQGGSEEAAKPTGEIGLSQEQGPSHLPYLGDMMEANAGFNFGVGGMYDRFDGLSEEQIAGFSAWQQEQGPHVEQGSGSTFP